MGKNIYKAEKANDQRVGMIDYNVYEMSVKEKVFNAAKVMPVIYLLSYLLYKNHLLSFMISFSALLYPRFKVKKIINKRKEDLNVQFKDMLYSLQSSLWAGKPIELAFREVVKDLHILYPDPETYIILESSNIAGKIEMNETVENAVADFGERSGIDDIQDFAEVLQICKRTGGNLVEVVKRTTSIINDRIEMKQDINTMLAKRNLERRVLNIIPVAVLILLSVTADDYINPVYCTVTGRIAMTFAALMFVIAYLISKKIMDIDI
ncbi:MAG TPA: pilus assembly protein TadB [Clostridiales bacterium]|nr:pilus assembly protein TadB [Clostridiales bacterium]